MHEWWKHVNAHYESDSKIAKYGTRATIACLVGMIIAAIAGLAGYGYIGNLTLNIAAACALVAALALFAPPTLRHFRAK